MKNKLFIIEGPDGAGKTQMAQDLKKDILEKYPNLKVRVVSLPYTTSFGYKKLREILSTSEADYPPDVVQSLFILNMISTADNIINPFFASSPEDHIMILDRSLISTVIYNALNDGTIFSSMLSYSYTLSNMIVPGSVAPNEVDFDIINKVYGHIIQTVEAVFFLLPPQDILIEHAIERDSKEENDSTESVIQSYHAYSEFQLFLQGLLSPSIMTNLKYSPQERFTIPENKTSKYIRLSNWDEYKTEEENYKMLREEVLAKLNL